MSIFARRDGVIGESSDPNHSGWMDILTLKWDVNRKVTSATSTRGDRESANAVIGDLVIVRRMDKATPKIFIESCCGTGKDVEIHLTKTGQGNGSDVFMSYTLRNSIISGYRVIAHKDDLNRPNEEIRISFTAIETRYTPYDENGVAQAPAAIGFDTKTNTQL
ncbi:MAG: Hcp family type VI secretion system effector [Cellvibrionaceae bacterium]